ncbi:MAG: HAMP domain-containing protein, partial [bacterium]|nr:HAMP domain-containing protein [bacterium]
MKGESIGCIAFQIPTDPINAIVQQREGMGTTGESYLVGKVEDKTAFRSDMLTMGEGKYVIGYEIHTEYIDMLMREMKSIEQLYTDSTGNLVMIAADPLKIKGLNWGMVSKMNASEAIAPTITGETKDFYTKYIEKYGYYDLFLFNPEGYCFYTVAQEADYQTNFVNGKYSSSNLGKLVRNVLSTKQFGMADFAPYAPSDGDPCAFVAQPVISNGKVEVVVALQLPLEAINSIMQERAGMGKTGETYLIGSDKLMRSDSFLDPQGHTVKASFAGTVAKNGVDTEAAAEALSGNTDAKIITDYNGNPVLSAYTPLKIGDITWALLSEVDEAEVLEPINNLIRAVIIAGLIIAAIVAAIALFVAVSIAGPLVKGVTFARLVAKGDLTAEIDVNQQDEVGMLASAMQEMIAKLREVVGNVRSGSDHVGQMAENVKSAAENVSSTSEEMSSTAEGMSQGATEQAAASEEASSSMEEMGANIKQNADNSLQTEKIALQASEDGREGGKAVEETVNAMKEIAS